jgi:hypothetical protein
MKAHDKYILYQASKLLLEYNFPLTMVIVKYFSDNNSQSIFFFDENEVDDELENIVRIELINMNDEIITKGHHISLLAHNDLTPEENELIKEGYSILLPNQLKN